MALLDMFDGMNIFGARPSGALTETEQEKLKNQALFSGLLGSGLMYLAQPKNQRYGSALPYLAKSYLSGMTQSQNTYDTALKSKIDTLGIAKTQKQIEMEGMTDPQKLLYAKNHLDSTSPTYTTDLAVINKGLEKSNYIPEQYIGGQKLLAQYNSLDPQSPTYLNDKKYLEDLMKVQLQPKSTIIQMPNPAKAILDVDKETLTSLVSSTNSARSIANYTRNIDTAIGNVGGSGVIKLSADIQNYLGIKTPEANVNQLINAIATKGATEIRTPNSGSTSDLEFGAYRDTFPTLATSKEGRMLMVKIATANANRMAKLSDWARKNIQAGTFSYEGLGSYDDSLGQAISADIKKQVDSLVAKPKVNDNNTNVLNADDTKLLKFYTDPIRK